MNTRETTITIIGIIIIAILSFLAGTKYDKSKNNQLQYQIRLKVSYDVNIKDSIAIFDGSRYVGTVPLTYGEPFAELILKDNE
jgi:hypothetical protein